MKELLPDIERWRSDGKQVAVATVVAAYGSAPRKVGSKMAVSSAGEFVGSVSGGCVENDVVEHALQVLAEGTPRLIPYGISDEMAFGVGLACGGQIEVFVQPFGRAFPLEKPVAFVFVIQGEGVGKGLLTWESGKYRGSLGQGDAFDEQVAADAEELLRAGKPGRRRYSPRPGSDVEVYIDVYPAEPTVIIFGGVHIGVSLARLARVAGFRVIVVDARGAWANDGRFPSADEVHVQHADEYLSEHPLHGQSYVAVLSHDPKLDDPAILGALQSRAPYVGAVGSPKTQVARRERLLAAGLSTEQMDRLRGPIGLDIGAETPEEIAVSILAEMIAARRGRLGTNRRAAGAAASGSAS